MQNSNRRTQTTNIVIVTAISSSDRIVMISADEYSKLSQYQESWNKFSTLTESVKKYHIFSSNIWAIDSNTTNHMIDNSNIFSNFRLHKTHFPITIADGSINNIVNSRTKKLTSSIILSFVLSLPKLTFNLIYMSKLTKDFNCFIHSFLIIVFFKMLWWSRLLVKDMYQMIFTFLIHGCLNWLSALMLFLHLKHIVNWNIIPSLCWRNYILNFMIYFHWIANHVGLWNITVIR